MNDLPPKFILSVKPKDYLNQPSLSYCGMYTIKGILSAYGKDNKNDIKDYSLSWLGKYTGWTFPWTFEKLFRQYGLTAEIKFAREIFFRDKVSFLKQLLVKNKAPIILLVGNGYLPNGRYSPDKGKRAFHWVTLWGYNDKENAFYLYDSAVPKELFSRSIPIGNKKRTYTEVIRDWGTPFLPMWSWNYLHITISNS